MTEIAGFFFFIYYTYIYVCGVKVIEGWDSSVTKSLFSSSIDVSTIRLSDSDESRSEFFLQSSVLDEQIKLMGCWNK